MARRAAPPEPPASPVRVPERPRLRPDVATARVDLGGEPSIVVGDRARGRYVRLGGEAEIVLALLDGSRTLPEIAGHAGREVGASVPEEAVRAFVTILAERGFLDGVPGRAPRRRLDPLSLRLGLLDPDRALDRVRRLAAAAFSPAAVAVAIVIGLCGGALLLATGPAARVPPIDEPITLVAFYVAASLALTAHEIGHALALKGRGGVVHETGIMLLYGMPCLYVNVSDAWLLPARGARLLVSAAGLVVEVGLFGVAAAVMALAPLDGVAAVACFAVVAVCGLRSILLNLNPLVRLDGYYLLSDAVGIPNLRPRAFGLLADLARRLAGRRPVGRGPGRRPPGNRRERIVLGVYGILAFAYGVLLIAAVLLLSGRWLVARMGPVGLAPWAAAAVLFLWRPVAGGVRLLAGRDAAKGGTPQGAS